MENVNNNLSAESDRNVEEILSLNHFIILSIFTLGIYPIWWTYKAWRFFRDEEGIDVLPAVRALFSYFFLSSLFRRILHFARRAGYVKTFSPVLLHIAFVVAMLLSYLPEPYFLLSCFYFVIFIAPFEALNFAKLNTPGISAIERSTFNKRQLVVVILGAILLALATLGFILGPEQAN